LLYQLSQEGNLSQRQMAVWLGCHQSTISRELRRNQSSLGCYLPDTAQAQSETRWKNAKQPFKNVSESALELVKKGLKDYHSPEQIAGHLKRVGQESLSHETIYQMIYQNYPWLWEVSRTPASRTRKKKEKSRLEKQAGTDTGPCGYLRAAGNRWPENRNRSLGKWQDDWSQSSRSSRYSCRQGLEISSGRIGQEQNCQRNQSSDRRTFSRDSLRKKKNLYLWQGQRILWTSRFESKTRSGFLFCYSLSFLGEGIKRAY